jgi:porin
LNVPAPAYPVASLGARAAYKWSEHLESQAAIYDGQPDPRNRRGRAINQHGVDFGLDEGVLVMAEQSVNWAMGNDSLAGKFKLGGWWHSEQFEHLRLDAGDGSLADPGSSGDPRRMDGNWGIYGVMEQTVWSDGERNAGVFCRVAGAPPDRNLIEYYFESGFTCRGPCAARPEDVFSVGAAYEQLSSDLRKRTRESGAGAGLAVYELILEATYTFKIRPWWTIQPDVQWIINPSGARDVSDAVVIGLRTSFIL